MREKVIRLLLIFAIGSGCFNLFGQDSKAKSKWFETHPIDFAIGNIYVGLPYSKIFTNDFYPMATLGTEFYYLQNEKSEIFQTARIGGYKTKYNTSSIFLNSEIGYRYKFNFGLFTDVNLGVGYSHLFRPNAIYKMNSSGEYEQVRDWGKPSIMANYLVTIGYNLKKQSRENLNIFLRYGNYAQLLYAPDLPIVPQNSFQIGIKFLINKK